MVPLLPALVTLPWKTADTFLPGAALIFFRPSAVKVTVTVCPLVATW